MVFIRCPFLKSLKYVNTDAAAITVDELIYRVSSETGVPEDMLVPYDGCKQLTRECVVSNDTTVHIMLSLPGGKGGFGSMLRAIGAQIEKTTNREACRDLSGRRLRDINEEQRLKKWLAKKIEREAENERRHKERLQRMRDQPKHDFNDPDYNKMRSELPERIDDALSEGLKKEKPASTKREHEKAGPSAKRACLWLDADLPSDSDSSEELDSKDEASSSSKSSASKDADGGSVVPQFSDESTSHSADDPKDKERDSVSASEDKAKDDLKTQAVEADSAAEQKAEHNLLELNQKEEKDTDEEVFTKDLTAYESIQELEELGLGKLKEILKHLGLKCGGTLSERAQRIWSIRGLDPKDFPAALRAKANKKSTSKS